MTTSSRRKTKTTKEGFPTVTGYMMTFHCVGCRRQFQMHDQWDNENGLTGFKAKCFVCGATNHCYLSPRPAPIETTMEWESSIIKISIDGIVADKPKRAWKKKRK